MLYRTYSPDSLVAKKYIGRRGAVIGAAGVGATAAAAYPTMQKVPEPKRKVKPMKTSSRVSVKDLRSIATDEGFRFNNDSHIAQLASKIRDKGYDQKSPVKVSTYKDGSQRVTDGHHRLSASETVGRRTIPVKVNRSSDKTANVTTMRAFRGMRERSILGNRKPRKRQSDATINRLAGRKLNPILEFANKMQAE